MPRPPLTMEYVRYCSPEASGEEIVPPLSDESTNLVEPGYAVIVESMSVGTYPDGDPGTPVEAAINKQIHLGAGSWWLEAVNVSEGPRRATPKLGKWFLPILRPGERLGARVPTSGSYYCMYTGVKVPLVWLPLVAYGVDVPDPPPPPAPLEAISIMPSVAGVGQPNVFSAYARGGTPPYQFKWWLLDGATWTLMQDWGADLWTWAPTVAGAYRVGIWVRSAGETADTNAVNLSIPVVVT